MNSHALSILMYFAFRISYAHYPHQTDRFGFARGTLDRLVRLGYLHRVRVFAIPPVPFSGYRMRIPPGQTRPDFGPLAYAASLMSLREATELTVLCGTRKNARTVGGFAPSLSHVGQLSHDLASTEILVCLRRMRPQEAARFVGESLFMHRHRRAMGRFVPDAAIVSRNGGRIETALEFVGPSYTSERLTEIWRAGWTSGTAIELWAEPRSGLSVSTSASAM